MFTPLFCIRLKERRTELSLSQFGAAKACGMKRARWSDLERGYRQPNAEEFKLLCQFLKVSKVFVPPPAANRTLLHLAARRSPTQPLFFPSQDRHTYIRFRSCAKEYPALTGALLERIQNRGDFDLCEYLCHRISCDSNLEPLHLLYLLSSGAEPGLRAPYQFGHTRWPIVDCKGRREVGFRARPCMVLDDTWYFFQVSFKPSRTIRVDTLCWNGSWYLLEVNGKGHDFSKDRKNAAILQLPLKCLTTQQLIGLVERHLLKDAS